MQIYEELQARGLIAQVTDEDVVRNLVNEGKAVFYIGFDPTADSLHVGHFMALCLMKRLQMAGNKPIALIGGGTGMVGDPSGKTDMRKMLTKEQIEHNCQCFKKQMEKFIDFSDGKALMVNNGKATFYIGFDPTADSLHVGHFMALCLMKRLQMAGNKPIALIGGGTAMIGDPSGRTDMRQMMTKETINHNVECFKKQMSRFIDFSDGKAILVNNADWLLD